MGLNNPKDKSLRDKLSDLGSSLTHGADYRLT